MIMSKKVQSIDQKRKRWVIVKTLTIILCITAFVLNSLASFKHFIEHETITTIDIKSEKRLPLSSITICGDTGFKKENNNRSGLEIEQYLNNTFSLNDIIDCIKEDGQLYCADFNTNSAACDCVDISELKVSTIYSGYRGRCYTIEYPKEVNNL